MKRSVLHRTIRDFYQPFLADFSRLTEQDVQLILADSTETFLMVLHNRYGYTRTQSIRAWNEFVLRHVDGRPTDIGCPNAAQAVLA